MTEAANDRQDDGRDPLRAPLTPTMQASTSALSTPVHDVATQRTALRQIQRSISDDHPWVSTDHIGDVLRSRYERTHDAKVQNFRLVLAERETRTQLRHEQRRYYRIRSRRERRPMSKKSKKKDKKAKKANGQSSTTPGRSCRRRASRSSMPPARLGRR